MSNSIRIDIEVYYKLKHIMRLFNLKNISESIQFMDYIIRFNAKRLERGIDYE